MSVSDAPEQAPTNAPKKKKGRAKKGQETHVEELRALLGIHQDSAECRRLVWNKFFENDKKMQLKYLENTLYTRAMGTRCCDNCEPRLFPIETVIVEKVPGLKRAKRKEHQMKKGITCETSSPNGAIISW